MFAHSPVLIEKAFQEMWNVYKAIPTGSKIRLKKRFKIYFFLKILIFLQNFWAFFLCETVNKSKFRHFLSLTREIIFSHFPAHPKSGNFSHFHFILSTFHLMAFSSKLNFFRVYFIFLIFHFFPNCLFLDFWSFWIFSKFLVFFQLLFFKTFPFFQPPNSLKNS